MTEGQPVQQTQHLAPAAVAAVAPSHNHKGPFEATVLSNKALRKCFYKMGLQFTGAGAEAFIKTRPGQFGQFDLSTVALPAPEAIPDELKDVATRQMLLRRPFSFARVAKEMPAPAHPGAGPSAPFQNQFRTGQAKLTSRSFTVCSAPGHCE